MSNQEYLTELVAVLERFADLQLEYAEICEQLAFEAYTKVITST
jgi:hypothetical protein